MSFLNPSEIVDKFDIRPGSKVADFGCGSGHFTVEIAKRLGDEDKVYAFDVQEPVLDALKGSIDSENLANIEPRRVDLETENGTGLADGLLDVVLISNMLFQSEDKNAVAKEAYRVLKSGGKVIVIEWSLDFARDKIGPTKEMRIEKGELENIFTGVGFKIDRDFEAGESHYGLIFLKN